MAQPVKLFPSTPASRVGSGAGDLGQGSTSASYSPFVDEITPTASTYIDNAPFAYRYQYPKNHDNDNRHQFPRRQHFGVFNAPSETFVSIMELGMPNTNVDALGNRVDHSLPGNISKAVHKYEISSTIVSTAYTFRGKEISLIL